MIEKKVKFSVAETNYLRKECTKFHIESYETEEMAKKEMQKKVEECIEKNKPFVVEGDVESGCIKMINMHMQEYIFELLKKDIEEE